MTNMNLHFSQYPDRVYLSQSIIISLHILAFHNVYFLSGFLACAKKPLLGTYLSPNFVPSNLKKLRAAVTTEHLQSLFFL